MRGYGPNNAAYYHVRVLVILEKLHDHTQSTAQSNAQVSLCQNVAIPTALNIPEERIVTDRSITARTRHCGHS